MNRLIALLSGGMTFSSVHTRIVPVPLVAISARRDPGGWQIHAGKYRDFFNKSRGCDKQSPRVHLTVGESVHDSADVLAVPSLGIARGNRRAVTRVSCD